jgi:hypothetical protein
VTGKKVRSDFNALFDHVVVLSEERYGELERELGEKEAKKRVLLLMIEYSRRIKQHFGFVAISIQLHLSEGHYERCAGGCESATKTDCAKDCGRFIRNVHAHVSFFNYDFKRKVAPLRHLMKKGKSANGKTNNLNPNFVRMQDIASDVFSALNFRRGLSQNIAGRQHLSKEKFVKEKLNKAASELSLKQQHINSLQDQLAFSEMKHQRLEKETRKLEEKRGWLKDSIKELQHNLSSLENALRVRCQEAIYQIYSKVKNSF